MPKHNALKSCATAALATMTLSCSSDANGKQERVALPAIDSPAESKPPTMRTPGNLLVDTEIDRWMVINDGVMGGKSQSTLSALPSGAIFSGIVSPDNGGGFASIRAPLSVPLEPGLRAVSLRVRGDGKLYQFRVRTNSRSDGPAYKHSFKTEADTWQQIVLPLRDFEASFRGRSVQGAAPLSSKDIRQLGFLIADGQYGTFNLEIEDITLI